MATFISTIKFTEQGIKAIGETTKRAASLKAAAKKMGVKDLPAAAVKPSMTICDAASFSAPLAKWSPGHNCHEPLLAASLTVQASVSSPSTATAWTSVCVQCGAPPTLFAQCSARERCAEIIAANFPRGSHTVTPVLDFLDILSLSQRTCRVGFANATAHVS